MYIKVLLLSIFVVSNLELAGGDPVEVELSSLLDTSILQNCTSVNAAFKSKMRKYRKGILFFVE